MDDKELKNFWFPDPMTTDILSLRYLRTLLEIAKVERAGFGDKEHCMRLYHALTVIEKELKCLT